MIWLILFSPLIACVIITLLTLRYPQLSAGVAMTGLLISFVATLALFIQSFHPGWHPQENSIIWIHIESIQLEIGWILDKLSLLMLLVVTGIGSTIFIYSLGYMEKDPGKSRYFASLSLFAFSMLGIILSNNFIQMFIFWELVGASSYLLIGFWFEKDSAADAGNKAFLVNRVGDFGFMLGILLCWTICSQGTAQGTFNFHQIESILPRLFELGLVHPGTLALVGTLIFCGVLGKSAQFPLHVWLPDAMEGPTPVSALIHAATMVAAGIYLLARLFFLFDSSPDAMILISYIGGFTSIFAASIALVQNDIKRILAYSTLSQLGLMVMAMGLGAKTAGMYHLATHAFFKALLFLGAGSVIHALHTQNIWEMGALSKKMSVTTLTFLIGSLALAAVFPFSGFWSKDEILLVALQNNSFLYKTGLIVTWMTAFYMSRAVFVAFLGPKKWKHAPHESPKVMTGPLIILAIGAVVTGFIGIPEWISGSAHEPLNQHLAILSQGIVFSGVLCAFLLYSWRNAQGAHFLKKIFRIPHEILIQKYYIDPLYQWIVDYVQQTIAISCQLFDRYILMRLWVNGVAKTTRTSGEILRFCQTGRVQTYALIFFAGVAGLVFVLLLR